MKHFFIAFFLLLFASNAVQSQNEYRAPFNARYSSDMTLDQLYDTTFLQKMSKEDWVRFTQDPRFDADRVVEIKTRWKELHKAENAMTKSLQTAGESNCTWIQPTTSYTHPNTIQWPGNPGNSTDNFSAPINLGWNFNFFGQTFNQVVLTTKGTIALGATGYIDFTPSAFPDPLGTESNQQYDQIAGFWSDFDFGGTGDLYYLLTPQALYVNYINVGYWPNGSDKKNSFQMIITPDGSPIIGGGNNVQFTYYDMQWANSQISGANGGCQANTNLAVVGCDRATGNQHYAFGRFNICNSTQYNGPYGVALNQQDGVDWLDGRVISFNTSIANFNINQPPQVIGEACDTIRMCIGETFNFDLAFTSPESNQTTTITFNQSGTGFSATPINSSASLVNAAQLSLAQFVASASNVGSNTVNIIATDNGTPVASRTVTYVFIVEDIVPPPITISGVSSICAGGETLLTASEGFDSYTWSNGANGMTAAVTTAGNVTVVGHYGICSAVGTLNITVTPYFIPQLVGGNNPIPMCPGQDTTLCVLGEYESYEWYVYPGYTGEFVTGTPLDEPCVQVTGNVNGNYGILVTDSAGCQGLNIKLVNITESFVCASNADNNGPQCNGLQAKQFCGYSNPPAGHLTIYGLSTSANGWQGSYINIYVYPASGAAPTEYFFTTFNAFTVYSAPVIGAGDSVAIEYFANGNNFQGNSLWVINCGQNTPTIIPAPLNDGIVWSALSTCVSTPLQGQWTVTGPSGWNMTSMTTMNTTFTPTQYGNYQLCFADPACSINHCYNMEYTQAPTLTMTPGLDLLLCDTETSAQTISISDIGGTGSITWTGQGAVPSANNLAATLGPYTGYVTTTITATVTNGCGTASDSMQIIHHPDVPEPSLNNQSLCAGASVTLDPIPASQDNSNLHYQWTPGNATTPTLNVTIPGTYSVIVNNLCDVSNSASASISGVVAAGITSSPNANYLECNTGQVPLSVSYNNASQYTIAWTGPITSSSNAITATIDGNYCWNVTDIHGCGTSANGCANVDISSAPSTSSGSPELTALCPRECKQYDLIVTGENVSYSWSTNCSGLGIGSSSATLQYCADNVPTDCLGIPLTITGTVSNGCGSDQATWQVQSNACEITIPNVFTPNGGGGNDKFYIKGLENYTNVHLTIFNRWGDNVFESKNYLNNWTATDLAEGTYWYFIQLPFGLKTEYKGFFTILR